MWHTEKERSVAENGARMSVKTSSARTTFSGQVGTSAAVLLAANTAKNFIRIVNPAAPGAGNLWVTYDGTTPVVGQIGIPIFPGGWDTNDNHCPTGAVTIIADTASTYYYGEWA